MNRAESILDALVSVADSSGFTALGMHVLAGDEGAGRLWAADVRRDIQSASKGICVLAAGIAVDEGIFEVDVPVSQYFPDWTLGDGVGEVTIRHLLAMTSGIDVPWSETMMTQWPDLAREFLGRPSAGRVFHYSNASTYTAMRALSGVVGDVLAWLEPRLLEPLGIVNAQWERCPHGWIQAGGGLALGLSEFARLGQLIRDDGRWQNRQLVSRQWTDAMHSEWSFHEAEPNYQRYGLAGWGGPGRAWRLHGAYGQMLIFIDDVVVTVTANDHFGADAMAQRIVDLVEESSR